MGTMTSPDQLFDRAVRRLPALAWAAPMALLLPPFAFALAAPSRALAAMFLMLGLVARAAAATAAARLQDSGPILAGLEQASALVGKTELFVAFAAACVFPNWFSLIAYVVGILCFVAVGSRVAANAVSLRP